MLTCISCSKQRMEDGGEEAPRGTTPTSNDAVKSLTTQQIKDMALKISGAYKCKPGQTDDNFNTGQRCYPEFDTISEGVPNPYVHCGARPDSAFVSERALRGMEITTSTQYGKVMPQKDGVEPKEWMAQVEPGVQITFVSLPHGGKDLKRIRFSRDTFDKWQAQRWWGENYDRIMELYNVQKFNHQALNSPRRSEDEGASIYPMLGCTRESPRVTPLNKDWTLTYGGKDYFPPNDLQHHNNPGSRAQTTGDEKCEMLPVEESRTTAYRGEAMVSISTATDIEPEWTEEDEPGVYITIRQLVNGTRELRRVKFSRERFEEVHAKHWWETNRERIQTQYLR
ncbi:hypothetical protein BUALT_Bualt05G0038100 [Buddleja alternifolia]|uniref:BRX domain-containing protein n=1 Tax=Buddleja alternifolia TaxID=168488 RepID=A0AAV6XHY7_9LAMI|nr:hypothetical protein BUALT_Bualt05G0038100 [Buddleja alternifolia]